MERLTALMRNRTDRATVRALALAGGAAAVAVLAAGCGGSGAGSAAGNKPVSAQQAITLAAQKSARLNSAGATVTVAAGSENLSEDVQVQLHPQLRMSTTVNGVPGTGHIQVVVVGQTVYLKLAALASLEGRPWVELPASGSGASTLVHELLQESESGNLATQARLAQITQGVHVAGHQTVDGVPTTEYAGSIKASTALAHLPASLRALIKPMLSDISGRLAVRFWVDAQHTIRKVSEVETVNGQQVATTIVYRAINQPVQVSVPPASQVKVLTSLPKMVG
jgi:hypothetical protein